MCEFSVTGRQFCWLCHSDARQVYDLPLGAPQLMRSLTAAVGDL